MKKNLLILIGIAAMFISENVLSQSTMNLKEHIKSTDYDQLMERITPKTDIYRPGLINKYYWNNVSNVWEYQDSSYHTYDCDGYVTQILISKNGVKFSLETITYHPNKMIATKLLQKFFPTNFNLLNISRYKLEIDSVNNVSTYIETNELYNSNTQAWSIDYSDKYIVTFDANHNEIENLKQEYNTTTLIYEDAFKRETNYAGNNPVEIFTYYSNGVNLNLQTKTEYQYVNNLVSARTDLYWDGSQFIPTYRVIDYQWENWNLPGGQMSLASAINQTWSANAWKNLFKFSRVPQQFGGEIHTDQKYENGNWIDSARNTIVNNSHLDIIKSTYVEVENSNWVLKYESETIYTYDSNDNMTQRILRPWNTMINAAENDIKYDYSDFKMCSGNTAGTEEISMLNASVYPNPFENSCTISVENEGNYVFHLVNLNGQVVGKESFTSTLTFHKNDLKPGIYIYTISSDNGNVKNGKLIIE